MNFTTLEIAELTGAGHEGPSCVVQRVAIDPGEVVGEDNLLFATSAHPPPLGDTSLRLEDEIAERVPYLTERPWVAVSYTHLRAHETVLDLVCRLLLEKKKNNHNKK